MIPCIKNKCITYPACITKRTILCYDLHSYFSDIVNLELLHSSIICENKKDYDKTYKELWDEYLEDHFQNLDMLKTDHINSILYTNPRLELGNK